MIADGGQNDTLTVVLALVNAAQLVILAYLADGPRRARRGGDRRAR